jgi:hypothetical protein
VIKKPPKNPQKQRIFLLKIGLKSVKSAKSASKKLAWLRTKSKQMEILKRRDRQCLSGDSIFQMSRLYHGRQATSVTSVSSVAMNKIRDNPRNQRIKTTKNIEFSLKTMKKTKKSTKLARRSLGVGGSVAKKHQKQ